VELESLVSRGGADSKGNGLVNHVEQVEHVGRLGVMSYELGVMSWELGVMSWELGVGS